MISETRDSAPGGALIAVGVGLLALSAAGALPEGTRVAFFLLLPALTYVSLWAATSFFPLSPGGQRKAGYGLVAVLVSMASLFVPLTILVGPVKVLSAGLLILGARQRDLRQIVPAVLLMILPIDVEAALPALQSRWATVGLVLAAAGLVAWGVWVGRGEAQSPADPGASAPSGPVATTIR